MKKTAFLLLLLAAAAVSATPTAEEKGNAIILRNGGAEYKFEKGKFYHLLESRYQGRKFWLSGFGLTYNLPGDKWYWENRPCDLYKMAPRTHRISRKGDALTLETRGEGKNITLIRDFTLRGNSPALEVKIRLEIRGRNIINWLNLFSTNIPVTNEFWCLVSRVREGKVVTAMEHIGSPFLDPGTKKFRTEGNFRRRQLENVTFVCSYDKTCDVGAAMMQMPEKSRLPLRVGMANENSKSLYCNVSPYFFSGTAEKSFLQACFRILPFTGSPEQLNKEVVPAFVESMQRLYALPKSFDTGKLLKSSGSLKIWSDLSSQKVYPSSLPPAKRAECVELFAARGEGEGFNLALRSSTKLQNITWQTAGFPGKAEVFPVAVIRRQNFTGIMGEHPDVLLEKKSLDIVPNRTALLYIKVSIPENTRAGVYKSAVRLYSNKKLLAELPVKVTVRDFSISERTLTAAWDFWWRKYGFNKQNYKNEYEKLRKMVIDARGGGRWLASPRATFDAQGNLLKVDYSDFDNSVKLYTAVYKQPLLIARCFMLGYGHKLQKNFFGSAQDIMTPLWQKKMLNFAKDFRKHLQTLKISDRIVMDLFDEPEEDSFKVINETVKLLRSVAPEWRFTYAGNYRSPVSDAIDFWNTSGSISLRDAAQIKAKGGEYSFYNPPVYKDNGELVKVRGYYNYLWNEKIRYVYQWVINCWAESGNPGWDESRSASWTVPSTDGPLSTLRMENTREGIEDYEYCAKLEKECARVNSKAPALAAAGRALLEKASKLNGRSAADEIHIIISNDPDAYETLHREAGELLEKMAKVK